MILVSINYHYVRPTFPCNGIHGITPEKLEEQLTLLNDIGTFVSGWEIRKAVENGSSLPEKSIVVTFDDGLREQYDHAWPVLRRLGVPALFFVNTAPLVDSNISTVHKIHHLRAKLSTSELLQSLEEQAARDGFDLKTDIDFSRALDHYKYDTKEVAALKYLLNMVLDPLQCRGLIEPIFHRVFQDQEAAMSCKLYMNLDQIRELARLECVGTHCHDHLPLGLLGVDDVRKQVECSVSFLGPIIGYRPFALSYPYGTHEACSVRADLLDRSGIRFAFTMERALNVTLEAPLFLARFDNNDVPGGKAGKWPLDEFLEKAPHRAWRLSEGFKGKDN